MNFFSCSSVKTNRAASKDQLIPAGVVSWEQRLERSKNGDWRLKEDRENEQLEREPATWYRIEYLPLVLLKSTLTGHGRTSMISRERPAVDETQWYGFPRRLSLRGTSMQFVSVSDSDRSNERGIRLSEAIGKRSRTIRWDSISNVSRKRR